MMDLMFLMNFIIIFTLFLAIGVLIIIFYQIIKIDFKKLREITKEIPSKKESLKEASNERLEDVRNDVNKSVEVDLNNNQSKVDNQAGNSEKQTPSELSKVDDVEALLKGASSNQESPSPIDNIMDIKTDQASIKLDQSSQLNEKQSSQSTEKVIEKKEPEELSEVESLLKAEEVKPSDINKQFMELSEYVKKLRDSLKSLKKDEV